MAQATSSEAPAPPSDTEPPASEGFRPADLPRQLGRYVLLRRIARGGMGEVYLAATMGLEGAERPVVVKIIRREHIGDKSFLARFLDEARVQAQLNHVGVAQVVEATRDDITGEPFVAVEHVDGRSLSDIRARCTQLGERLDWAEAASIAALIAEALDYVHDRRDASGKPLGIVHRDLSPQNVMVSYDGDVKLIDFGTARGENRRCHTVAGVVFAKPGYVAPEVAGGDPGDGRVDLYALGVMLWEMCIGRRFLEGDAADHMAAVARGERNPPALADEIGCPAGLDVVIAGLTAVDRNERYARGSDAARDLAQVLSEAPAMEGGVRGLRARVRCSMTRLFGDEPARFRRTFARLVVSARKLAGPASQATPVNSTSTTAATTMTSAREDLLAGTRYQILRELGSGASSQVFEAEHVDLGWRVALKVLSAERASSGDYAMRFRREARILSELSHPGLVAVRDFGPTADGRLFCAQELCDGETLAAFLDRERGMDYREALRLTREALRALAAAHEAGLVHRDIKPPNLFLTADGGLKLLDFGLAMTPQDVAPDEGASSTLDGMTLFGTPDYMAPEQASGGQVDERADIYAMGCVLYEMLTGGLPFERDSAVAVLEAKIKGSPPRAIERAPHRGIPEAVDDLVMRAIARHPSLRFSSANEMIDAIEELMEPAFAATTGPRRRRRALSGGLVALGMTGLLAGLGWASGFSFDRFHDLTSDVPPTPVAASEGPAIAAESPPIAKPAADERASAEHSAEATTQITDSNEQASDAIAPPAWPTDFAMNDDDAENAASAYKETTLAELEEAELDGPELDGAELDGAELGGGETDEARTVAGALVIVDTLPRLLAWSDVDETAETVASEGEALEDETPDDEEAVELAQNDATEVEPDPASAPTPINVDDDLLASSLNELAEGAAAPFGFLSDVGGKLLDSAKAGKGKSAKPKASKPKVSTVAATSSKARGKVAKRPR